MAAGCVRACVGLRLKMLSFFSSHVCWGRVGGEMRIRVFRGGGHNLPVSRPHHTCAYLEGGGRKENVRISEELLTPIYLGCIKNRAK